MRGWRAILAVAVVVGAAAASGCAQIGQWTGDPPRQPATAAGPAMTATTATAPNDFNWSTPGSEAEAAAAAPVAAAPAAAASTMLTASLDGSQESPVNFSPATGAAQATYDPATKTLVWSVVFQGLSGAPTAAHFHGPAPKGQDAGVQLPIGSGSFVSPATGSAVLTDAQAADLLAGLWYVNIHTATYPNGEIRGWLKPQAAM